MQICEFQLCWGSEAKRPGMARHVSSRTWVNTFFVSSVLHSANLRLQLKTVVTILQIFMSLLTFS